MKRILFFGDSVTDCGRAHNSLVDAGKGYAAFVKSELTYKYPAQYEFVNKGISGNRVVDLYARKKVDLINLAPDYVSILIGVNDVGHELYHKNGVNSKRYEDVYTMLIEDIKEALPNVKIFILEPFCLKGAITSNDSGNVAWDEFFSGVRSRAEVAHRIAEKFGLPFVELQKVFENAEKEYGNSYVLEDGVHPTTYGHMLIAKEWIKCFEANK